MPEGLKGLKGMGAEGTEGGGEQEPTGPGHWGWKAGAVGFEPKGPWTEGG